MFLEGGVCVYVYVCVIPGLCVFFVDKKAGAKQVVAVVYTGVSSMYVLYVREWECVCEGRKWEKELEGGRWGQVQATSSSL